MYFNNLWQCTTGRQGRNARARATITFQLEFSNPVQIFRPRIPAYRMRNPVRVGHRLLSAHVCRFVGLGHISVDFCRSMMTGSVLGTSVPYGGSTRFHRIREGASVKLWRCNSLDYTCPYSTCLFVSLNVFHKPNSYFSVPETCYNLASVL